MSDYLRPHGLSMEFSRPEYWSGWPLPSPGDLPNPGIKPRSPALQADSSPAEPQGKAKNTGMVAYPFSSWSSWLRNWTGVSCITGGFFTNWAMREALYAEYIMQNAGLNEAQAGIKIAGRNSNNHKYVPPLWQKGKRNWRTSWWEWKTRVKKLDKTQHSQN